MRIGKYAYVSAGSAFSGGTLARDVSVLNNIAENNKKSVPLLHSIITSNNRHKKWVVNKLKDIFSTLEELPVLVLGLTYKPGTDTLRRSLSLMICQDIHAEGARIQAFDPAINSLPSEIDYLSLATSVSEGLKNAQAVVVLTAWPEFKEYTRESLNVMNENAVILDPNRILHESMRDFRPYYSIGLSSKKGAS